LLTVIIYKQKALFLTGCKVFYTPDPLLFFLSAYVEKAFYIFFPPTLVYPMRMTKSRDLVQEFYFMTISER